MGRGNALTRVDDDAIVRSGKFASSNPVLATTCALVRQQFSAVQWSCSEPTGSGFLLARGEI